jgi:hypothetical protein
MTSRHVGCRSVHLNLGFHCPESRRAQPCASWSISSRNSGRDTQNERQSVIAKGASTMGRISRGQPGITSWAKPHQSWTSNCSGNDTTTFTWPLASGQSKCCYEAAIWWPSQFGIPRPPGGYDASRVQAVERWLHRTSSPSVGLCLTFRCGDQRRDCIFKL